MQLNDTLFPLREGVESCIIIDAPVPPAKWTVRYESGRIRKWSKSHLRKYYAIRKTANPNPVVP